MSFSFSNFGTPNFGALFAGNPLGSQPDSFVLPIVAGIIGVAMLIAIVYVIIQYVRSGADKVVAGPIDLFAPLSPVVIDRKSVKSLMSGSYTLAFYIQMDAIPDMRATTPLFVWPSVWNLDYSPATEQMIWKFTQTPASATDTLSTEAVVLPSVPLQRWMQIVMAFEGRSVDLYINGALKKSERLNNLPRSADSSITIVPNNIMGKLAHVQLWPRRLSVNEAAANYTDTSDSQGRPLMGPGFFNVFSNLKMPNNIFCPNGNCTGTQPTCSQSQTWEFPYA